MSPQAPQYAPPTAGAIPEERCSASGLVPRFHPVQEPVDLGPATPTSRPSAHWFIRPPVRGQHGVASDSPGSLRPNRRVLPREG